PHTLHCLELTVKENPSDYHNLVQESDRQGHRRHYSDEDCDEKLLASAIKLLSSLEDLSLFGCSPISRSGYKSLIANLPSSLQLEDCLYLNDEALYALPRACPNLVSLAANGSHSLMRTELNSDSKKKIAQLSNLRSLELCSLSNKPDRAMPDQPFLLLFEVC